MQAEAAEGDSGSLVTGVTALSLEGDIESLDLDDLTFDDYFNFDTPTDKMDVINLDEDTEQLSFVGLDWDDYFDLESPTEKTIAITLDESAAGVEFDELGVDDDDFDFDSAAKDITILMPTATFSMTSAWAMMLTDANDGPIWLEYDDPGEEFNSDDPDRPRGDSTL